MLNGLSINHYTSVIFISLLGINPSFAALVENNKVQNTNTQSMSLNKPNFLYGLQPIFTFIAGASISQLGRSQSFAPLDECRYSYKPNHSDTTHMLWGGFAGSEVKSTPTWVVVAGLSYYQPTSLATKGRLTQGPDAESSDIYKYRYKVQSQQLLAEGKWYWTAQEKFQPFLTLGIGAAFNKTSHYQTSAPPSMAFTPEFSNHRQTHFTYAIGPGIDVHLTKLLRLGIGYRFTDLGAVHTGSAQIDRIPITSTLKQSHLYANQVFAQFTFIPSKN
jgi:opacity protein-like surface antigen